MNYLKMVGLAVLACAALMAFGAGSASAKVCSNAGGGSLGLSCGAGFGTEYTGPLTLSSNKQFTFSSGLMNVACSPAKLEGDVTKASGEGRITNFAATGCTNNYGGTCTIAASGLPWSVHLTTTTAPNGKFSINNVNLSLTCVVSYFGSTPFTCKYGAATFAGAFTGGEPATVTFSGAKVAKQAGSANWCSNEGVFSGGFNVTAPGSLFLV
jgi:hypothetical protein